MIINLPFDASFATTTSDVAKLLFYYALTHTIVRFLFGTTKRIVHGITLAVTERVLPAERRAIIRAQHELENRPSLSYGTVIGIEELGL